jgi:dienelactone hydrolase
MFQWAKSLHIALLLITSSLSAQIAATPTDTARKALDLLLAQKYPELTGMFSESLRKTVTIEFLQGQVTAELNEFGKPQSIGEVVLGADGGNNLVSFPVQFSNTNIHIQFTLNKAGEIAGLYFRPPNKALPLTWSRPAYSKAESFKEREVTIGSEPWELAGTLTTPTTPGRVPAVILVHGPGPNDRNESMFATRIFEDLAEGLSSRGYAVLRYEKRTKTYGEELSRSGYTLDDETVQDAVAGAALLRKQPEVDPNRIYVLGHSLGGYAAPRIATADGKLAGIILLAGLARPVEDAGFEQTEYVTHLKGDPAPAEQGRLDRLKAEVERVKSLDPKADNPMVAMGLPTAWWLNVKGYDPPAAAQKLGIPMLVLQGERDFQVTMKDFALWQAALSGSKDVTFHSYPTLNDLFIAGQGKGSPAEYHALGNVAPAVIDDIAAWLSTQKR